jgi:hypothetical protein
LDIEPEIFLDLKAKLYQTLFETLIMTQKAAPAAGPSLFLKDCVYARYD